MRNPEGPAPDHLVQPEGDAFRFTLVKDLPAGKIAAIRHRNGRGGIRIRAGAGLFIYEVVVAAEVLGIEVIVGDVFEDDLAIDFRPVFILAEVDTS